MFMRYFKEYLAKLFKEEVAKIVSGVPKDYMLSLVVSDFAETVRWWMKNDRYSPEEIAGFFLKTVPLENP